MIYSMYSMYPALFEDILELHLLKGKSTEEAESLTFDEFTTYMESLKEGDPDMLLIVLRRELESWLDTSAPDANLAEEFILLQATFLMKFEVMIFIGKNDQFILKYLYED